MKKFRLLITTAILGTAFATSVNADAQYYQIANQLPGLIQPALSGGMNYRGFVEGHYLKGIGSYNADIFGASTSQGFQYADWFFMGVGIGVDGITSHTSDALYDTGNLDGRKTRTSGVMIPIFTDFRFNIGGTQTTSFFADLKLGCSFLIGQDYIRINNGYLSNQEYFYLRPTLGVRIPVQKSGKQAVSIGLNYQLLTSNYWSSWSRNVTLNSLGASVAYEW